MTETSTIVHFASCTGHGGDSLHILALALGQRQLGYDARILIGSAPYSALFAERAQALGVPCVEVPTLPLYEHVAKVKRITSFVSSVAPCRPSIIHLHTGGLAVRAAEVLGSKLIACDLRIATIQWPFPWPQDSQKEQARWRSNARLLDQIICPSSVAKRQQTDAGISEQKVAALPNAANVDQMRVGDADKVRRELGLSKDQPMVLFLARVEAQKRPLDAIGAFARVAAKFPTARFVVAGTGDLEEDCQRFVREAQIVNQVSFLGYRTDVADLMKAADIYILPTAGESFGITLVEAMAAGAALITSRIPPLFGEVVPEDAGLFAPVGDIDGFALALTRLLADPSLRKRLAGWGERHANAHFSAIAVARKHQELYNDLLQAKGRQRLAA